MKSKQLYTAHKKESNPNHPLAFLLLFVYSALFLLACSKNNSNNDTVLTQEIKVIILNTTKGKLKMNYTLTKEILNRYSIWKGEVEITDSDQKTVFSLSHKSSEEIGNTYKHTYKDTKNNKIVFTTDTSLGNPVLVKEESSLSGYAFS